METIGLFQLENLMLSRAPHLYLDLRENFDAELPKAIIKLLEPADRVSVAQALAFVQNAKIEKHVPVLLISEDEKGSEKAAAAIEAAGFENVYAVAGGVLGLLSEL